MKKAMLLVTAVLITALLAFNAYAGLTVIEQGSDFDSISASDIFGKTEPDAETETETETESESESETEAKSESAPTETTNTERSSDIFESETASLDMIQPVDSGKLTLNVPENITDTVDVKEGGCKANITWLSAIAAVTAIAALVIKKDEK